MWSEDKIDKYLRDNLKENRYIHTYGVVKAAEELSEIYGVNKEKARLASLLHDCAKYLSKEEIFDILHSEHIKLDEIIRHMPDIMHGVCAAIIAKNLMGVHDEEVLEAVRCHTTGKANMTNLDKIIYLADCIEENRKYSGVDELRDLSRDNLDEAVIKALEQTMLYVIKNGHLLHPETIKARNYLILNHRYLK
ncbi:putative HD superfamily hydrolase of NAD metabolism [Hathewaya proteolytica DSM 3090]|uniref:bis(5'-nucleosyl)-tetraphosphatase (symmetrical) n=1 Tax=Hathewaya proteolytica DSM 3090 TaxID=1121331 RepID=A0A1M6JJ40_9CLOT|nr:bis(5'-nucleosyl)-tetraphosphatase (symmetrical) YqeK [Hathewaya proteolytica]SHJ46622.1 putative HD superfamily hydrolase of NAD metabolism [Hathewaya proteolytica DSM 3090]